jgi:type VI secretion system FHA domain protein
VIQPRDHQSQGASPAVATSPDAYEALSGDDPWDIPFADQTPVNFEASGTEGGMRQDDPARMFIDVAPDQAELMDNRTLSEFAQTASEAYDQSEPETLREDLEKSGKPDAPHSETSQAAADHLQQATQPADTSVTPPSSEGMAKILLAAFCEGAGLKAEALSEANSPQLMYSLGESLRVIVDESQAMLNARRDMKRFTRTGSVTVLGHSENNPLKMSSSSEAALTALFGPPREGYLSGSAAFADALTDLRMHQSALLLALQPALKAMLAGLAPEEIENAQEKGGLFSNTSKSRNWSLYVERWDAKAQSGENGMLDMFLKAFAHAYSDALQQVDNSRRGYEWFVSDQTP